MKHVSSISLMGAVCLFSSCDHEERMVTQPKPAVDQSMYEPRWPEADFTPWMSRAELQYLQNTSPSDQYFAHVEGRNVGGRLEYRAVVMPFTGEQYEQWAVFWGIDEEELFKCEMNLLASGFVRQDTQVFADPTGRSIHQIVWLKPKTRVGDTERNVVVETVPSPPPVVPPQAEPEPVVPPSHDDTVKEAAEPDAPVARAVIESPKAIDVGAVVPSATAPEISKSQVYVVRQGDTLGKIAKNRKVSVADLKTFNHLKSDVLRIGQKLKIPVSGE